MLFRRKAFAKAHVDNFRTIVDSVAYAKGNVFIVLIAIRHARIAMILTLSAMPSIPLPFLRAAPIMPATCVP
jgi:hypothetical protein